MTSFNWLGTMVFFAAEILIAWEAFSAYQEEFFTVKQMRLWRHIDKGLPFMAHLGMWGECFLISPILGIIVAKCGYKWDWVYVTFALFTGSILSWAMHEIWKLKNLPESHIMYGQLTTAGKAHRIYMAGALAILLLFFFVPIEGLSVQFTAFVYIILGFQVFCGSNIPLGILRPYWYEDHPEKSFFNWAIVIGVCVLLGWRYHSIVS